MIQVAILAGGLGTRLGPQTLAVPKPMVPIHNRPFLEYQLLWLKRFGFDRVLLLVGHLAEKIMDYFGEGKRWGLSIRYSRESTPMGTAGAIKEAEALLEERFLVLNGDTFLPIDYRALVHHFREKDYDSLIVAYDNREKVAPNNLSLAENGHLSRYDKKSCVGMTHVDAGVYAFKKKVLERIPVGRPFSLEVELLPDLIRNGLLSAYPVSARYYDIGTPERLERFRTNLPVAL